MDSFIGMRDKNSVYEFYHVLLNDGAQRNRFPYSKIVYTAIRKILYLPKFFAFFSPRTDSLTLKVMTTPYFAQI